MKPLVVTLLAGSLVLNATLAFFAFTGSARVEAEAAAKVAAASAAAEARTATAKGPAPVDPKTWASLETPDLPDLITRLRAAGFPKDVIRAIISGLIAEKFADRQRALQAESANRPFWKELTTDLKTQAASYKLYQEQNKMLRDILGADAEPSDALTLARQRAQFGNIPQEKVAVLQEIMRARAEKQTEMYYTKGSYSNEDMRAIDRETHEKVAAVLTPAELVEYDLRNSNTARQARNDLLAFNPTEEEFRAIVKLRTPMDEQFSNYTGLLNPEQRQRQQAAEKQLNEQIVTLFGPERGAEYIRATDYSYRQTAQLVARLELPAETTTALWDLKKDFEQRRSDLYRGVSSPDPAAREELNKQLVALQAEATAKIAPILGGANRVEAYKQYGGSWLSYMVPQTPRAAVPVATPK